MILQLINEDYIVDTLMFEKKISSSRFKFAKELIDQLINLQGRA